MLGEDALALGEVEPLVIGGFPSEVGEIDVSGRPVDDPGDLIVGEPGIVCLSHEIIALFTSSAIDLDLTFLPWLFHDGKDTAPYPTLLERCTALR